MKSIWTDLSEISSFPQLRGDKKTDVLIIGGGITGILTAYMLKQAGIDYILAEAEKICCGITRNTTAKITAQHGLIYGELLQKFGTEKTQMYLHANLEAVKKYRELCRNIQCGFEDKDSFVYSIDDRSNMEKEITALEKAGFRAELAETLPLPFSCAGAVKFPCQAQFNPMRFLAEISKGLNIYENTRVLELKKHTAVTNHGRITADKIIAATHFPFINKHGSYFLKMYQHRSYVIALENGPDVSGMYVDQSENGMSFRNYENYLLIGGSGHRTGKQSSGWRELESFAKRHYPLQKIKYRWATQDCMTLDKIPYIGHYSANTPYFYTATGFNKWGMTSAMTAASILTDMVTGKENPYAAVFSPSKSILRPRLIVNAIESAANLLSFSKKRCPHLGCALKWNPHERTWDCPCHGSRFEENGKLIDNPATGDLNK